MESQENSHPSNEALLELECERECNTPESLCHEVSEDILEEISFSEPVSPSPSKNSKSKENSLKNLLDEKIETPEKIQFLLETMEGCLKHPEPRFKRFWEAKECLLPLFKIEFAQKEKQTLWERYREISLNAVTLKKSLQEKNSFAFEQIQIALEAIHQEFQDFLERGAPSQTEPLVITPFSLEEHKNLYQQLHKETVFLNSLAAKMHSFRKELTKMEGGGKGRSAVFTLLSTLSDAIFPKRRESILQLNTLFREDVQYFIDQNFGEGRFKRPFFALKEEIKALQDLAKVLPLDAPTFSETRLSLSSFWDSIKEEEKEKKKLRQEQKVVFEENFTFIKGQIDLFLQNMEEEKVSLLDLEHHLNDLYSFMRERELGKDELKVLREEIQNCKKKLNTLLKEGDKKKKEQQVEEHNLKEEKENALKNLFITKQQALLESVTQCSHKEELEGIEKSSKELVLELKKSHFSAKDKRELEAFFETYKDAVFTKRSQWVIPESQGEKELKEALKEQKERRVLLKKEIDLLKGTSSNLNFMEALAHNEKIAKEKSHLEEIDRLIVTLENKLKELN